MSVWHIVFFVNFCFTIVWKSYRRNGCAKRSGYSFPVILIHFFPSITKKETAGQQSLSWLFDSASLVTSNLEKIFWNISEQRSAIAAQPKSNQNGIDREKYGGMKRNSNTGNKLRTKMTTVWTGCTSARIKAFFIFLAPRYSAISATSANITFLCFCILYELPTAFIKNMVLNGFRHHFYRQNILDVMSGI